MPHLAAGENISWSTSNGLSIVNSNGNSITITPNSSTDLGLGTVTATWENTNVNSYVYYGKPDLSAITYDLTMNPVSDFTIVSPNTIHTITLPFVGLAGVAYAAWNPSPSIGAPYGSDQYDFSLVPGQSLFLSPLSLTNSCGTSTRTIEFWADWSSARAYPNPASDILTVEFARTDKLEALPTGISIFHESSTIAVKTISIKEVFNKKGFIDNKFDINVSEFKRGTYYLHIQKGEGAKERVDKKRVILN